MMESSQLVLNKCDLVNPKMLAKRKNHNDDVDLGMEMIKAAADSGADVVKIQTFNTNKFLSKSFPDFSARKNRV